MERSFEQFLDIFLQIWRTSSLPELKEVISPDYLAREVGAGEIVDFGFEESIKGWEQGFDYVKGIEAQWKLNVISIIPLREDEVMVILSAALDFQGKSSPTANLFFESFKKNSKSEWKLVRSYIEAGIPIESLRYMKFNEEARL